MEKLKAYAENLDRLYFSLNGMYAGIIDVLKKHDVKSEDVSFLEGYLDPAYIGDFLELVDEYVINKINHGLENYSYLYNVYSIDIAKTKLEDLYNKTSKLNKEFVRELSVVESGMYNIDSNIVGLGTCCEEMRSVLDQIDECLFVINNQVQPVGSELANV